MTCDDCQAIVIDIARGGDVPRALRDDARRHAALCSRCGEYQQEQEWLTAQLRAVAAADATLNAPPRVEIAALAAWRAAHGVRTDAVDAVDAVGAVVAAGPRPRRTWVVPGVALAGLAAAAMAMVFVWPSAPSVARGSSSTTPTMAAARQVDRLGSANDAKSVGSVNNAGTRASLDRNTQDRDDSVAATAMPDEAPVAAATARSAPRGRVEAVMARSTLADGEFMALPDVEPLRATEARHVVRVSMNSGDELLLGVVPADRRSGQPFEADVLVGEDGIARAIRIVQ